MQNRGNEAVEACRLNKYLAHAGICSRRDADKLIEQGRVLVNGMIPSPGLAVTPNDEIKVNGKVIQGKPKKAVLAFYKPVGITCSEKDAHAEKLVKDLIHYPTRVTYAGRLDKDSEGLLLLTNDGDLIQKMMKGSNRHEKEYIVKTDREVTEEFLEKMRGGVYLKELDVTTRECEMESIGKYTFRIILTQGFNRQIRRMCQAFGYQVKSLKRVRVMTVELGKLKPGEYVELKETEMKNLYEACGLQWKE